MGDKTRILAIGGGKGGVGKSYISASLAIALAQLGKQTVIVDMDLGGANLHTLFGLKTTSRGIGDFIYTPTSPNLIDYVVDPGIPHLKLISGNGFIPGIANMEYFRKVRVVKALSQIEADYVVLDLGAGTSFNVIDFFTITQSGIIVTMHEPTAILNGYEFLKNVVFRMYSREFKDKPAITALIDRFKTAGETFAGGTLEALFKAVGEKDPAAEQQMRALHAHFHPAFIVNMCRADSRDFTRNLEEICRTYLSLKILSMGSVPHDPDVQRACLNMRPFMLDCPNSKAASAIRALAMECVKGPWMDAAQALHMDEYKTPDPLASISEKQAAAPAGASDAGGAKRTDAELNSLLMNFITESSALTAAKLPAPAPSATAPSRGHSVIEDLVGMDQQVGVGLELVLAESGPVIRIPVSPRLRPNVDQPFFMPLNESGGGGLLKRLFGGGPAGSAVAAEFEHLRSSSHMKEVGEDLNLLASKAGRTPAESREWIKTGLEFVTAHRMPLARKCFDMARQCAPDDEIALNNYAAGLMSMGALGQARDVLDNGLVQHRQSACLRFNLGLAHLAQKQYKEAASCFVRVRSMALGNATFPADFLEGYCLYMQKNFTGAETMFRSIVSKDSGDAYVQFNWALAAIQVGQVESAVPSLSLIINDSPGDSEATAARAVALWRADNKTQSLVDLGKAIILDPANIAFLTAHAAMAYQVGRLDVAIADLQRVTRLVPKNETFQRLFSSIRSELNQPH